MEPFIKSLKYVYITINILENNAAKTNIQGSCIKLNAKNLVIYRHELLFSNRTI